MTEKQLPFCGLPQVRPDAVPASAAAVVLGAGSAAGGAHAGPENGPYFLRTLSKAHTWSARTPAVYDLTRRGPLLSGVVDAGDLDVGTASLPEALRTIETAVAALPPAVVPAVIGGDHTVTLPVVSALRARAGRPFTVVHFDHHLDLQTWDGAPGRPNVERAPVFNTNVMSHVVDLLGPGRLVQIGVGPYATVEADSLAAMPAYLASVGRQIPVLSAEIEDPAAVRAAVGPGADVYVSVDVDVLDSQVMSSTGYPAEVGLGLRELVRLIDLVLAGNRLIGFDVVEFGAPRDARDATTLADAGRAVLIVTHLLAWAAARTRGDA
jgi:arginase family enzyme